MPHALIPVAVEMYEIDPPKVIPIVAFEAGIFAKNDLRVDLFIAPHARDLALRRDHVVPLEHVHNRHADIVHIGGGPTIVRMATDATANPDQVIIATFDPMVHWWVIAAPYIQKPDDLKGKKLGVAGVGTVPHEIALEVVKHMGWDPNLDLSLMQQGCDLLALKAGRVDAIIATELAYFTATTAGLGYHAVIDTRSWNIPLAGSGVVSTRSWLQNNPDAARLYMQSIVEAIALVKSSRQVANEALARWFNITNPEFQKIMYDGLFTLPSIPFPCIAGIERTMELYDSHWMRQHKPSDFHDSSILLAVERRSPDHHRPM